MTLQLSYSPRSSATDKLQEKRGEPVSRVRRNSRIFFMCAALLPAGSAFADETGVTDGKSIILERGGRIACLSETGVPTLQNYEGRAEFSLETEGGIDLIIGESAMGYQNTTGNLITIKPQGGKEEKKCKSFWTIDNK